MCKTARPFWVAGLSAAAACLLCAFLPLAWLLYIGIGLTAMTVFVLCFYKVRALRFASLVLVAVTLATWWFRHCEVVRYQPLEAAAGNEVALCASVEVTSSDILLTVVDGDLPKGTQLYLRELPLNVTLNDHVVVETTFTLHKAAGDALSLLQAKAQDTLFWLEAVDNEVQNWQIVAGKPTVLQWFGDVRERWAARVHDMVGGDSGAVITGICMGADELLSLSAVLTFRQCGISHLFAVSGLHLSVLTAVLLQLLKRCHVPRRIRSVITAVAVILFAMLVGWTASAIRAGFLCAVVAVGLCLRRQADPRNSLGLALVLLLFENPFSAYDVGLLLSFLATFGLLFFSGPITNVLMRLPLGDSAKRVWKPIVSTVAVTLSATLATLPVTVLFFGSISVVGVLANVLLSFPAMALLLVGWLAILCSLTGCAVLYRPLLLVAGWLSKALLAATNVLAVPTVSIRPPATVIAVLGGAALLFLGYRLWRYRGVAVAACLVSVSLLIATLSTASFKRDAVRIEPIPTEEGMAVVVHYERETVLVVAPVKSQTLYDTQRQLADSNITELSAVWVLSDIPYAAESTAVFLQKTIDIAAVHGVQTAELSVGGKRVVFTVETPSALADAVFTETSVTLYQDGKGYAIEKENNCWPSVWIRDGEWLLKSQ